MSGLPKLLKRVRDGARTAQALLLGWLARMSRSRSGVVLVYHRVGGDGGSDPDLEILAAVPDAVFERQLAHLRRHYRVVAAADLLEAASNRRRGRRYPVAITFDDDLSSHVQNALPALQQAGLTATFFLGGASLHGPRPFWWEDLQRAVDDRLVPDGLPLVATPTVQAALRRSPKAILDLAGAIVKLQPAQRSEVASVLRDAVGPLHDEAGLRGEDVKALSSAGCAIGFHTLRHEPLPSLSDPELARALQEGQDELARLVGRRLTLIAYPHGKADQRVAHAARAAGFTGGFTTAPGPVAPDTDPSLIPRTVADLSASDLSLRLARMFLRVH